jgi:hypothetical protein
VPDLRIWLQGFEPGQPLLVRPRADLATTVNTAFKFFQQANLFASAGSVSPQASQDFMVTSHVTHGRSMRVAKRKARLTHNGCSTQLTISQQVL